MDNKEKNYILALHRNATEPQEQYHLDMATGRLMSGTKEQSDNKANLGTSGALEILYELGRLLNRFDDS